MIPEVENNIRAREALARKKQELEELSFSEFASSEEVHAIEVEIKKIDETLYSHNSDAFASVAHLLDKFDLQAESIEKSECTHLYPGLLVKNEILMIAAKPASGKSLISIALANMLLNNGLDAVLYFDADNGLNTLRERGIGQLKSNYGSKLRYLHESVVSKTQMWQIIKKLQNVDLSNILIIFDSIKNFMGSGDRDKNKDVSRIMNVLKALRNQGATVIFLHHTNKPQADMQGLRYAGSSAWEEDTSNAFILNRNDFKNSFILTPIKKRVGELEEIALTYDSESMTVQQLDLHWAKETERDQQMRETITDFIRTCEERPIYSQIMKHLHGIGFKNNDKINAVIQAGKNRYWKCTKIPEQNYKDVYELITDKSDKSDCSEGVGK